MSIPFENKSSVKEIKQRFDKDVERFSNLETGQQAAIDAPLAMEIISRAAAQCNPKAVKLLDIGCGAGNHTLKILELLPGLNCDLVDLSQPMLDRAKSRISKVESGKIRCFQSDFRDVDLADERYDIIIAAAMLHHLRDNKDWVQAFRKIYNLTAPGGSVWISDMVSHEVPTVQELMWQRYGNYLESIGGNEYREKVFAYIEKEDSPRPVTFQLNLLKNSGFDRVDILHKNSCFAAFGAVKSI